VPKAAATTSAAPRPLTNQQRADQDAAAILAAFTAPSGARRLTSAPSASGGALDSPFQQPATPDLVEKTGWWQVAGAPQQVLSWAAGHLAPGFSRSLSGSGTGGKGQGTTWEDAFDRPPVAGVLQSRQLIIEVVDAGGGQTDIRVDAQVIWLPERTPGETIPAGATQVTLTLHPDVNVHVTAPPPVTVTDPAKVREIAALLNGLAPFPAGRYSCPLDGGGALTLTFRAVRSGPALAVAVIDLEGCEGVNLTTSGGQQPALGTPDGGRATATQAVKIAGLTWNLSRYLFS
jgi:hypothetical protein